MRIALATRHLADSTSTQAVGGLGRALTERGHAVEVFTQSAPAGKARRAFRLPCRVLPARGLAERFSAALERGGFDHVHLRVGGAHENPLLRGLRAFAQSTRAAVSLQFDDFGNPDLPTESARTAKALEELFAARARVCAISNAVRERVARRWPRLRGRIAVIPTGIDPAPANAATGRDVLCVGRLSPYKGLDLVLFASAGLSRGFRGKLVFAGYGTKDPYLARLAERLGLADRVRLLGLVSHKEIRRLLARSSFLVMGSRWEALGLSGLEAMAAGKPVIAPRLGGFLDYVEHGKNGLLFEPENPASLERAMRALVESPARARTLGRRARRTALRYAWPLIARRYLALWK